LILLPLPPLWFSACSCYCSRLPFLQRLRVRERLRGFPRVRYDGVSDPAYEVGEEFGAGAFVDEGVDEELLFAAKDDGWRFVDDPRRELLSVVLYVRLQFRCVK